MEAFREGLAGIPLDSLMYASLDDLIAFMDGSVDDNELGELLWALIGLNYSPDPIIPAESEGDVPFESASHDC